MNFEKSDKILEVKLHRNKPFFLYIDEYSYEKNRIEPVELSVNESRVDKIRIVDEKIKKYVADRIEYDGDLIANEDGLVDFIELLDSFLRILLIADREYRDIIREGGLLGGYSAEIFFREERKGKVKYLKITTLQSRKEVFLNTYDCKVIVSKFRKAYSNCIMREFLDATSW